MRTGTKAASMLAIVALALGVSTMTHAAPLTVKTEQGKVRGKTINDGKVQAFLGLPYAAPPVGDLRWRAPQPPAKREGERDATSFGAHCAQNRIWDDFIFLDSGASSTSTRPPSAMPTASCRLCSGFMAAAMRPAPVPSRATTATFCPSRASSWSPSTTAWASSAFWPPQTWPTRPTARPATTVFRTWWPRSNGSRPTSATSAAIPAT